MNSSIYISSEKIEAIGYTSESNVNIKEHLVYPLNEGITIGGTIIDPTAITEALKTMKKKTPSLFENPNLIIDGNVIMSKRLVVPKLSKKRYEKLVRDDFFDTSENLEEFVSGYQIISSKNLPQTALLTCGISSVNLHTYISVFADAGITLNSIRPGVQAVAKYVAKNEELNKNTVVVNVVDGMAMLSMIFTNGENVFTSRVRLYSENPAQYMQQIAESLSGLVQFCRAQNLGNIETSYYIGLRETDFESVESEVLMKHLDLSQSMSAKSKIKSTTHFALLGAMMTDDIIDFIDAEKQLERLKKSERPKPYWIIPGTVVVALTLGVIAVIYLNTFKVTREINDIKTYMQSPQIVQKSTELDELTQKTLLIEKISSQLVEKLKAESLKSEISNVILDIITKTNEETISIMFFDFDIETDTVRVNGKSKTEIDCSDYIEQIKTNEQIKSVKYTGYNYDTNGRFNFLIEITLRAKGE